MPAVVSPLRRNPAWTTPTHPARVFELLLLQTLLALVLAMLVVLGVDLGLAARVARGVVAALRGRLGRARRRALALALLGAAAGGVRTPLGCGLRRLAE